MPYYNKKSEVILFFQRFMQTSDIGISMRTVLLLLKNNVEVSQEAITRIADEEKYLGTFYTVLKSMDKLALLPGKYKQQLLIARSMLLFSSDYKKLDSISFLQKDTVVIKQKTGVAYAFKYRVKKSDEWKIGISGLQPLDLNLIDDSNELTLLTGKNLKANEPVDTQVNAQLKKLQYGLRKSAKYFYVDQENYFGGYRDYDD